LDLGPVGTAVLRGGERIVAQVGEQEMTLEVGVEFPLGNRNFRLIHPTTIIRKTVGEAEESHPYQLVASMNRATGPEATLTDRVRNHSHTIRSENRAVLLYILARRSIEDRASGRNPADSGWCTDEEVASGIWGRNGERMESGNLHVLIHRLRREIEDVGFDSSFLEKHRKAMRIKLVDVYLR
jgi:hypothetical protein